ncbi:MAG: PhoU domain-containing protein [Gemmatimonadota bacterium]|jgi:phosphate uptake regulator|nr:MAG: PhoU domain-containing protein [Gemmatimonadota bacterium]
MFRELLSVFRDSKPLQAISADFAEMLRETYDITVHAGQIFFGDAAAPGELSYIYSQDVRVNKLERKIRKAVVAHLSFPENTKNVPFCLALMSLVKDVERIGDYAKNLGEVRDFFTGSLPDDERVAEVREIRSSVEEAFSVTPEIIAEAQHERAMAVIRHGKNVARRCDGLVVAIARSPYDAATTAALVLGTRYYKRINGHVLNVLSSVVMPLHKLDYFDEDAVLKQE